MLCGVYRPLMRVMMRLAVLIRMDCDSKRFNRHKRAITVKRIQRYARSTASLYCAACKHPLLADFQP